MRWLPAISLAACATTQVGTPLYDACNEDSQAVRSRLAVVAESAMRIGGMVSMCMAVEEGRFYWAKLGQGVDGTDEADSMSNNPESPCHVHYTATELLLPVEGR